MQHALLASLALAASALLAPSTAALQEPASAATRAAETWAGRLQLRGGSVGGNPVQLTLAGGLNRFGDELASEALDLQTPVGNRERFRAWREADEVPAGRTLVLRRITWSGLNAGDNNGDGDVELWVGRRRVLHQEPAPDAFAGEWLGELRVRSGHEHTVCLVASNSSRVDVLLEGELVDDPAAIWPWPAVREALTDEGRVPGAATLLARSVHRDYEKATFSFQHGVRDDPERAITRNDWDLQYGNRGDNLDVSMVGDDRSQIADLGELGWEDVLEKSLRPVFTDRTEARAGHVYLAHTLDSDTDAVSLFRVRELSRGTRVELEWLLVELTELEPEW